MCVRLRNHGGEQHVEVAGEEIADVKAFMGTVAIHVALMTGCAGNGGSPASADCQSQVRADGIVYTSYGYTERSATAHSSAADCEDVGPDAAGSVLPESPRLVATWTFANYPSAKVLGVRSGNTDSFAVFFADSVSPD